MRRVAQPKPADQHPQVASRVHLDRRVRQGALRTGVQAAHQELVIQRHLGDDRAGLREQFTPPQTQESQWAHFVGENLKIGAAHLPQAVVLLLVSLLSLLLLTKLSLFLLFPFAFIFTSLVAHVRSPLIDKN